MTVQRGRPYNRGSPPIFVLPSRTGLTRRSGCCIVTWLAGCAIRSSPTNPDPEQADHSGGSAPAV